LPHRLCDDKKGIKNCIILASNQALAQPSIDQDGVFLIHVSNTVENLPRIQENLRLSWGSTSIGTGATKMPILLPPISL